MSIYRWAKLDDQSGPRSEEHTSELQSLRHLVCRLLLEKIRRHPGWCPPRTPRIRRCFWRQRVCPRKLSRGTRGPTIHRTEGVETGAFSFFFNDTATTEIYTLSLHDALPICRGQLLPTSLSFAFSVPPFWH